MSNSISYISFAHWKRLDVPPIQEMVIPVRHSLKGKTQGFFKSWKFITCLVLAVIGRFLFDSIRLLLRWGHSPLALDSTSINFTAITRDSSKREVTLHIDYRAEYPIVQWCTMLVWMFSLCCQYSVILASKCLCRWLLDELILQSILQLYSTFVKGTQQHANRVQAASASRRASGSSVCSTTWGVNGSSVGLQLSPMLRCVHDHIWSSMIHHPSLAHPFPIFHHFSPFPVPPIPHLRS